MITNEILTMAGDSEIEVHASFARLGDVVDNLPPLLLYPLHIAMSRDITLFEPESGLSERLGDLVIQLQYLKEGLVVTCEEINQNPDLFSNAAYLTFTAAARKESLTWPATGLKEAGSLWRLSET